MIAFVTASSLFADSDEDKNRAILTLHRMQTVASALGAYLTDFGTAPEGSGVEDLRKLLVPSYIRELPTKDGWDTPLRYSKTGKESFQIISAGADRIFESTSWSVPFRSTNLRDDAVFTVKDLREAGVFTRTWVTASGEQLGEPPELVKATVRAVVDSEVEKMKSLPPERQWTYAQTTGTMQWMTATALAVELYRQKNGAYPAAISIDELERALVPSVAAEIFKKDTWGAALRYVPSADRKNYKLVSAGADGVFNESSWNERVKLDTANDDAVIENGKFIRKWDDDTRPGDTREMRARHRFKLEARALLGRADERLAARDYAAAVDDYMKAVEADPMVADLERIRGYSPSSLPGEKQSATQIDAETKGEQKKVAALRQYLKLHPDDRSALEDLVAFAPRPEAEAILQQFIDANPRDPQLYITRATLAAKQGDFNRTIENYVKANELDPNNAESHYILGVALYQKVTKDPKVTAAEKPPLIRRGLRELERAKELKPDYFEAMSYRSLLLRQQALLESDPRRQKELNAEADAEKQRAADIIKRRREARTPQP